MSSSPSSRFEFARAAQLGRFVVLAGTFGSDASGRIAGDVQAQTRQALENLKAVAAVAGTELARAAKMNVFLTRVEDFGAMNAVYTTFFPKDPPARTTVVTALARPDALVQIGAVLVAAGQEREVVHPPSWVPAANPYSYGIRSGDTLYMAGLVSPRGEDNSMVEGDAATQTRMILDSAAELLQAGGMDFGDVVSSRVYLTSASDFGAMNEVYRGAFPAAPPARATVRTALMSPEVIVEITFVAVKDAGRRVVGLPVMGPAGPLPLSQGIDAGGRLFLSGMLGNTPQTAGNVAAQTREMMARIGRTLTDAGCGWTDVREAYLYVTDMSAHDVAMTEVARPFTNGLPPGLVIETGLVAPDGLVELMVTAAK